MISDIIFSSKNFSPMTVRSKSGMIFEIYGCALLSTFTGVHMHRLSSLFLLDHRFDSEYFFEEIRPLIEQALF